jgi:hypothetical protein
MPNAQWSTTMPNGQSMQQFRMAKPNSGARLAVAAAIFSASCGSSPIGPSKSVAGTWTAQSAPGHSTFFELSLTQSGDIIAGRACERDGSFVLFRDAPVIGDYPKVSFTPSYAAKFSGKFEENRDQIAGDFSGQSPLRFLRSDNVFCVAKNPAP